MRRGLAEDRDGARFVPRIALLLLAGLVLFVASMGIYALPALREPAPPGAITDYHQERVRARLQGKVAWFLAGSMVTVALVSSLPRAGRGRKP